MSSLLRRTAATAHPRPASLFTYSFDRAAYVRWRLRSELKNLMRRTARLAS